MAEKVIRRDLYRFRIFKIVVFCIATALALRLLEVQAIRRDAYITKTDFARQIKLDPQRGEIFDRNKECLVLNRPTVSLGLNIRETGNVSGAIARLAPVLNMSRDALQRKVSQGSPFIYLTRYASADLAEQVESLGIPGLQKISGWTRGYPHGVLACHLLGFTGIDNVGLAGVEYSYDDLLRGEPGLSVVYLDAEGNIYTKPDTPIREPVPGKKLVLTIDHIMQKICEEELDETVKRYSAAGGSVIVVQPRSGEILVLACSPFFSPDEGHKHTPDVYRLRPITDAHEMGSVMKVVVFSAALQENLRDPDESVFCENGVFKIYDQTVEDHEKFGWLSVREVLIRSSNIGMAKIGLKIPPETIYRYQRDFGFGVPTGIGLPGEGRGLLPKLSEWTSFTPAAVSYGYEVAATPLQVAMAYAALANGGTLMKPKIVKGIIEGDREDYRIGEAEPIRRIISPEIAEKITDILQETVQEGTGRNASIPGLKIAGKTGTARKAKIGERGYKEGMYISSFAGYYPATIGEAEYCICVMVDAPRGEFYASDVAAPTFKRILRRIVQYEGDKKTYRLATDTLVPERPAGRDVVILPRFINRSKNLSKEILKELGMRARFKGEGAYVTAQSPEPGTKVPVGSEISLQVGERGAPSTALLMPKIIGLTAREALNRLALLDIQAEIIGQGRVVHQTPEPGEQIKKGDRCILECKANIGFANVGKW